MGLDPDREERKAIARYDHRSGRFTAPRKALAGAIAVGALALGSAIGYEAHQGPSGAVVFIHSAGVSDSPVTLTPVATPTTTSTPTPAPTDTPIVSATPTPPLPAPVVPRATPKPAPRTVFSQSGVGSAKLGPFDASDFTVTIDFKCPDANGAIFWKTYPQARPNDGIENADYGSSGRTGGSVGHGVVEPYIIEIKTNEAACSWTATAVGY